MTTATARSEAEMATVAVAKLFADGVLPWNGRVAQLACRAVGVAPADVRDAYERIKRDGTGYATPTEAVDERPVVDLSDSGELYQLRRQVAAKDKKIIEVETSLAAAEATLRQYQDGSLDRNRELRELVEEQTAALDAARIELGERIEQLESARAEATELADRVVELEHELRIERASVSGSITQENAKRHRSRRMAKKEPEPGKRRCSRCKELKDRGDFYVKNPETGALTSMCHDCRAAYQRGRRLTAKAIESMNRAGIQFSIGDDDKIDGLTCAKCEQPLEVDDFVEGHTRLDHVDCQNRHGD